MDVMDVRNLVADGELGKLWEGYRPPSPPLALSLVKTLKVHKYSENIELFPLFVEGVQPPRPPFEPLQCFIYLFQSYFVNIDSL